MVKSAELCGACRALQEGLCAYEIAKLHHREAEKDKSRRVTTQANPPRYAKDVTAPRS